MIVWHDIILTICGQLTYNIDLYTQHICTKLIYHLSISFIFD